MMGAQWWNFDAMQFMQIQMTPPGPQREQLIASQKQQRALALGYQKSDSERQAPEPERGAALPGLL